MNNYFPDSDTPCAERVLLLSVESSYDYGHIDARVVRRAIPDRTNPDTGKIEYFDGKSDAYGYRNCIWSSGNKNAFYVENFVIRNQFDTRTSEPAYGWDSKFKDVYSIDLKEAEHMVRTLKVVIKKLDEFSSEFGYAQDFSGYLVRVAKILGIKKFAIARKSGIGLISHDYFEVTATSVKYEIDKLENSVRKV